MKAKHLLVSIGALLATAALPARAGLLTYQDVTFTSTWKGNVLTLEIDAAKRTGDWTKASALKALEVDGIGSYTSVRVTAAPKGASAWKTSSDELNAKGCSGGTNGQAGSRLCFYGAQMALADDMVFSFTFDGLGVKPVDPHVKVQFVNARGNKVGSLLSQTLPASPATAGATTPALAPAPAPTAPAPAAPVATAPAATPAPTPIPTPAPSTTPATTAGTVASTDPAPATSAPAAAPAPAVELPPSLTPPTGLPVAMPAALPATLPATLPAALPVAASQEPSAPASAKPAAKPAEVPEPHGIALLLAGLGVMGVTLRRRRGKA